MLYAVGVCMCRKNQLWGWALIALGIGILIGAKMGNSFLVCCLGVALIAFGFGMFPKK